METKNTTVLDEAITCIEKAKKGLLNKKLYAYMHFLSNARDLIDKSEKDMIRSEPMLVYAKLYKSQKET